jgi:hypothetical protein
MAGLRPSLAALLLFLAGTAVAAQERGPRSPCHKYSYPSIPSLQICEELDDGALSRPGHATTWRIWVESDGKPFLVRLHNNSPGVVRLQGGDDQILHMGCLRHHEVRRRVTLATPGTPQLEVRPYNPSPERESSAIAASLARISHKGFRHRPFSG